MKYEFQKFESFKFKDHCDLVNGTFQRKLNNSQKFSEDTIRITEAIILVGDKPAFNNHIEDTDAG